MNKTIIYITNLIWIDSISVIAQWFPCNMDIILKSVTIDFTPKKRWTDPIFQVKKYVFWGKKTYSLYKFGKKLMDFVIFWWKGS